MANRLFDAPDLVTVEFGDGPWSALGYDLQATRAAMELMVQDPCSEAAQYVAGSRNPSEPNVYHINAFSATVSARRNNRCALGIELEIIADLFAGDSGATLSAAEFTLWNGIASWNPNLQPSLAFCNDVFQQAPGTSVADSIGLAIASYSQLTVVPEYIVHLGVDSAVDLSALGYTETIDASGQLRLRATGAPIVVSPYYPSGGIGITGPVLVNVGEVAAYQAYSAYNNRTNIVGYQILAVGFDPSTSVIVT